VRGTRRPRGRGAVAIRPAPPTAHPSVPGSQCSLRTHRHRWWCASPLAGCPVRRTRLALEDYSPLPLALASPTRTDGEARPSKVLGGLADRWSFHLFYGGPCHARLPLLPPLPGCRSSRRGVVMHNAMQCIGFGVWMDELVSVGVTFPGAADLHAFTRIWFGGRRRGRSSAQHTTPRSYYCSMSFISHFPRWAVGVGYRILYGSHFPRTTTTPW